MEDASAHLNSQEAIKAAFREFKTLFPDMLDKRVLLEGLEYLESEDQWSVVVGFDTERPKYSHLEKYDGSALRGVFSEPETVREFRKFLVDGISGAILRMGPA